MRSMRRTSCAFTPRLQRAASRGFSLISAIFLLVVLAALGTAIVNVATVQHKSSAFDVQGARAYQSARAGIEWALYQTLMTVGYCNGPAAVTNSFKLPTGTTLSEFTVTVTCTPVIYNTTTTVAVPNPITAREITATACNQPAGGTTCPNGSPGDNYVQRVISARL